MFNQFFCTGRKTGCVSAFGAAVKIRIVQLPSRVDFGQGYQEIVRNNQSSSQRLQSQRNLLPKTILGESLSTNSSLLAPSKTVEDSSVNAICSVPWWSLGKYILNQGRRIELGSAIFEWKAFCAFRVKISLLDCCPPYNCANEGIMRKWYAEWCGMVIIWK